MSPRAYYILLVLFSFYCISVYYRESRKILSRPVNAWTEEQRADCAVVLTGSRGRVREGIDILSQGRIRKLIISGVYPSTELRDIFPQWPFYGPIIEDDVILEKRSSTTYGNAQQSLPLVEALKCKSVLLITSRLHMYRSERIFRAVYPSDMSLEPRAMVGGRLAPTFLELFIETTKSLFYDLWAY